MRNELIAADAITASAIPAVSSRQFKRHHHGIWFAIRLTDVLRLQFALISQRCAWLAAAQVFNEIWIYMVELVNLLVAQSGGPTSGLL